MERLRIFQSPRAYIESQNLDKGKAWNFSKFQSLYIRREGSEFLSPKAYMDGEILEYFPHAPNSYSISHIHNFRIFWVYCNRKEGDGSIVFFIFRITFSTSAGTSLSCFKQLVPHSPISSVARPSISTSQATPFISKWFSARSFTGTWLKCKLNSSATLSRF